MRVRRGIIQSGHSRDTLTLRTLCVIFWASIVVSAVQRGYKWATQLSQPLGSVVESKLDEKMCHVEELEREAIGIFVPMSSAAIIFFKVSSNEFLQKDELIGLRIMRKLVFVCVRFIPAPGVRGHKKLLLWRRVYPQVGAEPGERSLEKSGGLD